MWVLLALVLGGCAPATVTLFDLKPHELGAAVRCEWKDAQPVLHKCQLDTSRVTIDKTHLEDLLDQLHQAYLDEMKRRRL